MLVECGRLLITLGMGFLPFLIAVIFEDKIYKLLGINGDEEDDR